MVNADSTKINEKGNFYCSKISKKIIMLTQYFNGLLLVHDH